MLMLKDMIALFLALGISSNTIPANMVSPDFIPPDDLQVTIETSEIHNPSPIDIPDLTYDAASLAQYDNKSQNWGPGTRKNEENRPVTPVAMQEKYGYLDAYFIGENTHKVYLTIDEGYENGYTAQILDTLKEKECPAVFFVTMPYVKSNPELIERMIVEGHIVGAHSVTHPSEGMPSLSLEKQANEVIELHQYMRDHFNYEMTLFRYPAGIYSEQSLALLQDLGYSSVFWSFAYKDWLTDDQPEPQKALATLAERSHPGAIYLLHAVSSTNAQIMGDFIDQTRAAGYEFAPFPR